MEQIEVEPVHAAIIDAVSLMMVSDGVLDQEEIVFLNNMSRTLLGVAKDVAHALVENSLQRVQRLDNQEFFEHAAARLTETSDQQTLMVALQLAAMADGHASEEEFALLDAFSSRFKLSDEQIDHTIMMAQTLYSQIVTQSAMSLD